MTLLMSEPADRVYDIFTMIRTCMAQYEARVGGGLFSRFLAPSLLYAAFRTAKGVVNEMYEDLRPHEVLILITVYAKWLALNSGRGDVHVLKININNMFNDLVSRVGHEKNPDGSMGLHQRCLLLAKGVLLELDARGFYSHGDMMGVYAEDVYRFCERHHKDRDDPNAAMITGALLQNMQISSPAISAARCHRPKVG